MCVCICCAFSQKQARQLSWLEGEERWLIHHLDELEEKGPSVISRAPQIQEEKTKQGRKKVSQTGHRKGQMGTMSQEGDKNVV